MIFGNTRNNKSASPADKNLRRRNVFSATKNIRRKRMELRKIRSIAKGMTYGDPSSSSDSDVKDKEPELMEIPSTSLSGVQPLHDDVVSLSYGKISVIGRRREMEDAVAVKLGFLKKGGKKYDFFGVYDGHGGCGVADSCGEKLHRILAEVLGEESGEVVIDWEKLMGEAFERMDDEVNKSGDDLATTGSTAVVAVVGEDEIVVANCGDSRAVMYRGGAAVQLSDDHKPDRPDELERIEDSGGKVINWNGQRVLGVLATSRSIGDHYLKPFVITEPEVKVINRSGSEEFLILASDGLWDVLTNDVACHLVKGYLDGQMRRGSRSEVNNEITNNGRASRAAAMLAELAMARGSRDNISVVVVELKRRGTC